MEFNITQICEASPNEALELSHKAVAVPSTLFLYIISTLLLLFIGIISIDGSRGSHPYRKFIIIWMIWAILAGIITAFIIYSPNTIQDISVWVSNIWN